MTKPKNTSELFHHWAHMVQPEARCGNVSYRGTRVFSYNEVIGLLLRDDRVLLSDRSFSVTTSSHQHAARMATNHMTQCFAPYLPRYDDELVGVHVENRKAWEKAAETALLTLRRNPRRKKSVADAIAAATSSYAAYRTFFNLDWPELSTDEMRALVESTARQRFEDEVAFQKRREEQAAQAAAEQVADLELWRDHATDRTAFSKIALRLSKDGAEIETTRGAHVPVEVAPALWRIANRQRREGLTHVMSNPYPVGPYKLNRIEQDGTLVVGCHTIPFDELALMARKLNLGIAA